MTTALASLTSVHKRFGKVKALDGLDLTIKKGELLAVLGPNGAGKSTAIALLLGLERADQGGVELFGMDPQELEARRRIGIMMQEVALSPVAKARELITQVASYYPTPYEVNAVVKRLSLETLIDRPYKDLSGGQKRLVQFGMAVVGRPELMFLDEPSVGMDVKARDSLWRVVRDLLHEGVSIVLTTHYLEEAEALATRVSVLSQGKQVAGGTVDEIRAHVTRRHVHARTALDAATVRAWPEVEELDDDAGRLHIVTHDAESVLRRLLGADAQVRDIEVRRAGLAEAFTHITGDAGEKLQ